jgi:hypothetical protein
MSGSFILSFLPVYPGALPAELALAPAVALTQKNESLRVSGQDLLLG